MKKIVLGLVAMALAAGCTGGGGSGSGGAAAGGGADGGGALKPGDAVKIGVVLEFSGPTATYGEETWNGIQMALEDLKDKTPWHLEPKKLDNKSDPQETARDVQQLTTVDNVAAIIGAVASKNTKAGARIANDAEVPMISPGSTATDVTAIGPFVSRVCFIDDFQGEVMARFAIDDLGKKTAALVVDKAQDYCVGLGRSFQDTYDKLGGKIVVTVNYTTGESDFSALIEKVRSANPDCIYVPGYYGDVGPMLKQAAEKWAGIPKLGGDGWDSPQLFALAASPAALRDCYMSSHFAPDDEDPTIKAFVERYRKRYDNEPGSMAVLGYDALLLVHDALSRAGTADGKKLRDAINETKGLKGVTGVITLDKNRNPKKDAVILIPQEGKFKFRARVKASET
jgi:branched-chain amino acid transport system substrate-binding protein